MLCVLSYFSHVQLFWPPCTGAHQAPLSMEFSRQQYWNGLLFPSPGDLPYPGPEPASLESLALASKFFPTNATQEAGLSIVTLNVNRVNTSIRNTECLNWWKSKIMYMSFYKRLTSYLKTQTKLADGKDISKKWKEGRLTIRQNRL